MKWVFNLGQDTRKSWNRFWFDSRSDEGLAILGIYRICFAFVMLFSYVSRIPDIGFFYSDDGILPAAYRVTVDLFRYRVTPLDAVQSLGTLQALHALFLLTLLSFALGFFTRTSAILSYLLHMMFLNRNMAVQFGLDTVGTFFLFYFCFAASGARYSLDAWLWPARRQRQGVISHVVWRLMQVQVCVIYGYSGLDKLKGTRWWDGSALWDVLSAGSLQRFDMSFVAHAPILIATVVYVVLLWEVYFPVLIWVPRWRLPMLAFGVMMHVGIIVFMNLPSFGLLMIANYALFLREDEIRLGLRRLRIVA